VTTVVVSPYKVANFPDGGGHFWVYMQYVQGLRRAGCDVYWLEQFLPGKGGYDDATLLETFLARMRGFGLEDRLLLYTSRDGGVSRQWLDLSARGAEAVLRNADLLLNFHYAVHPSLLALPRRTALVDIDPGLLQLWIDTGQLTVAPHDVYLTIGETVGLPGGAIPDCGVQWSHFHPPVCLDLWPWSHDPACEAFTTVATWWSGNWIAEEERGQKVWKENTKRISFLDFVDLPRLTRQPLELALYLADSDADERTMLESRGWRIRHSREVAATPESYQQYIRRSRGEFSCAKPSCMRFQNAWVSDRTLCYLASGKPVVLQDTGPSTFLPNGEGMFRFTTMDEAAEAFEAINADYARHCRAARDLAETHFDATRVMEHILNSTLGTGRPPS
jgi:hypothetical protein